MGLGGRFSYKMEKKDELTPGPGMYTNITPHSIEHQLGKLKNVHGRSVSTLGFGQDRS